MAWTLPAVDPENLLSSVSRAGVTLYPNNRIHMGPQRERTGGR